MNGTNLAYGRTLSNIGFCRIWSRFHKLCILHSVKVLLRHVEFSKFRCGTHQSSYLKTLQTHDDVIKWRSKKTSNLRVTGLCAGSAPGTPHKDRWRGDLMFSLIYACTNSWVSNRNAGDLRRHHTQYDVTVMLLPAPGFACDVQVLTTDY